MVILGIDPGYAIVGWGVIDYTANRFQVIAYGAVTTEAKTPFNERLETGYDGIQDIIYKYKPDAMAIEKLFYNTNAKTVIDVAQARGVINLAAQKNNLEIFEYTPLQVKQSVVGYGRAEKKQVQKELDRAIARNEDVARLYERLYEDNVSGKVTDEWFMQLSNKYESERLELKTKIQQYREQLSNLGTMQKGKEQFISAVRKFMQMDTLTAPLLKELIDKIVVYETQGTGKHRTQRIVIYYRFVGYLEIPLTESEWEFYQANTRQGVAVEYISKNIPA